MYNASSNLVAWQGRGKRRFPMPSGATPDLTSKQQLAIMDAMTPEERGICEIAEHQGKMRLEAQAIFERIARQLFPKLFD